MSYECHVCGEPFSVTDAGIACHDGDGPDGIDHDADADHVPYALGDEQVTRESQRQDRLWQAARVAYDTDRDIPGDW